MLQIACPHSSVRIQANVRMFHILSWPFDAEASNESSEFKHSVRTSALCPGKSSAYNRAASGTSFDFIGGGMVYTSTALFDSARQIWTRQCERMLSTGGLGQALTGAPLLASAPPSGKQNERILPDARTMRYGVNRSAKSIAVSSSSISLPFSLARFLRRACFLRISSSVRIRMISTERS